MRRINRWGIRLFIFGILTALSASSLRAIPKTTIQDTLFNADGSKVQGSVTLKWNGFTASDGTTLATNSIKVKIVQGVLVVDLVPNENATPAGTSYKATYLLNNGTRFVEHWVVPESATAVTVSDVRIGQLPPAGTVISISQISGLNSVLDTKADINLVNIFTAEQILQRSSAGSPNPLLTFQDETGTNSISFDIPTLTASSSYKLPGGRRRIGTTVDNRRRRQSVLVGRRAGCRRGFDVRNLSGLGDFGYAAQYS